MGVRRRHRASDKRRHSGHQPGSPEKCTRGNGGHDEDDARPHAKLPEVAHAVVELLFGDEAEEQRHTRHRSGGEHGRDSGDGHAVTKSAEFGHVARARLVLDRAGDEKERTLVARVRQQVGQAGDDGLARADAEQQHQHAQRADRGVREHPLEIRFQHRSIRATHHRHGAHERDDSRPEQRSAEQRRHSGNQIDAGLHHGRRVQIGTDRRGRLHRVRQPEVKGKLRRLGERGQEHQADDRAIHRDGRRWRFRSRATRTG